MTAATSSNAPNSTSAPTPAPVRFRLPAALQVQVLLISWMLDRVGYDLAARPTVELALDAMLPKGQRKWIGSHESQAVIPPAPRGAADGSYAMQLAQAALEVAYVTSGATDAELVAYCEAMCAKGDISWTEMTERIINCSALLWGTGKINPEVRASMTKALDAFIEEAEQVVAGLAASGAPSNALPKAWNAFRRSDASRSYSRDGREFPKFYVRAISTLSQG